MTLEGMRDMLAELKEQKAANGGAVGLSELRGELRSLAVSLEAGYAPPISSACGPLVALVLASRWSINTRAMIMALIAGACAVAAHYCPIHA